MKEIKEKIEKMKQDGSLDAILKKMVEKENKKKDFIKTDEFKKNILDLKEYLFKYKYFVTDGIFYTETLKEQIFANKAIAIFETVSRNVSEDYIDDTNYIFPTVGYSFNDIGMSCTYGQGSFLKFWLKG